MGSLTSALDRLCSTNSLKYLRSGRSFIQRVYVAFAANSDVCLTFLQQCADYAEKVFALCLPSIASPTPSRAGTLHNLRERTMRLRSEMTGVSVENVASVQGLSLYNETFWWSPLTNWAGSRKFKAAYNKALFFEQKATSWSNTLLEKLSSWVVTDGLGLPDDALPDATALEQLRGQWVKARDSVSAALATLKNEPTPQLFYRPASLTSTRPRSLMKRWMMNLVRFSCRISD
jgi:hypothetical protein